MYEECWYVHSVSFTRGHAIPHKTQVIKARWESFGFLYWWFIVYKGFTSRQVI